jgi:uncharacterized membrane protein
MGVDLGFSVWGGRNTQALADTAALDMARYISIADSAAYQNAGTSGAYLAGKLAGVATDNSGSAMTFTYQGGFWSNGSLNTSAACYWQNPRRNPACNAVMVTATQTLPLPFAGGSNKISRSAIAAVTPEGGFSIGTYLLSLSTQASALNYLFSKVGASTSVTLVGYNGLATSNVTVAQLIAANPTLFTASNVMTVSLSGSQWVSAWSRALSYAGDTTDAATVTGIGGPTANAELCQMVSINGSTCNGSSSTLSHPALSTGLDVLQMLTTEAEVANGTSFIDLGSSLGIPGVADASLQLSVGQLPQYAFGPVGSYTSSAQCPAPSGQTSTCASSAQITATLALSVNVIGFNGTIDIPLSAAQGTATLAGLTCSDNQFQAAAINASTTTATASVTAPGQPINPIATMTISGTTKSMTFNPGEMPPPNASNPQSMGATQPTLQYSNTQGVFSLLGSVFGTTLQGALGPVLQSLGVEVGGANVMYTGTNCGAVSIVK